MTGRSGASCRLWRLRLEVDAATVDPVLERLAAADCAGTWQRASGADGAALRGGAELEPEARDDTVLVDAWFPVDDRSADRPSIGGLPLELERELQTLDVRSLSWEPAEDRDWLEEYRRTAQPVRIGDFELDPREPGSESRRPVGGPPLHRLTLPARSAFGTGSHETTRLVVEALQELGLDGRRVLDVGSGTGVLGFVARRLGASPVFGFDLDPVAAVLASENARLNRSEVSFFAGTMEALNPGARFDVVLVNVLPENLAGAEPEIVQRLAADGDLLVSAILSERKAEIEGHWRQLGAKRVADRALGDWTLLHLRKRA